MRTVRPPTPIDIQDRTEVYRAVLKAVDMHKRNVTDKEISKHCNLVTPFLRRVLRELVRLGSISVDEHDKYHHVKLI